MQSTYTGINNRLQRPTHGSALTRGSLGLYSGSLLTPFGSKLLEAKDCVPLAPNGCPMHNRDLKLFK